MNNRIDTFLNAIISEEIAGSVDKINPLMYTGLGEGLLSYGEKETAILYFKKGLKTDTTDYTKKILEYLI